MGKRDRDRRLFEKDAKGGQNKKMKKLYRCFNLAKRITKGTERNRKSERDRQTDKQRQRETETKRETDR